MIKFILSRFHPRPERRGFTLHTDKFDALKTVGSWKYLNQTGSSDLFSKTLHACFTRLLKTQMSCCTWLEKPFGPEMFLLSYCILTDVTQSVIFAALHKPFGSPWWIAWFVMQNDWPCVLSSDIPAWIQHKSTWRYDCSVWWRCGLVISPTPHWILMIYETPQLSTVFGRLLRLVRPCTLNHCTPDSTSQCCRLCL